MGLSFHDENGMVEVAGSLHFAPASADNSNLAIPEIGSVSIIGQERGGDDMSTQLGSADSRQMYLSLYPL